eukprot:8006659-Heterocapsa_arctica.AAC.1
MGLNRLNWAPQSTRGTSLVPSGQDPAQWDALSDEGGTVDECAPDAELSDDDLFQGEEAHMCTAGSRRAKALWVSQTNRAKPEVRRRREAPPPMP